MKRVLTLGTVLLLSIQSFAQTYVAQVKPTGSKNWGYVASSGEMILEDNYRKCTAFSEEGLALYYVRPYFKIINLEGEVIPSDINGYKILELFGFGMKGFQDGMLAVHRDDKWGFLNTEGKVAIDLEYDKVIAFNNGKSVGQKGEKFYLLSTDGSSSLIDIPDIIEVNDFVNGLAPFRTADKKWGFIDSSGQVAIPAMYMAVGYFTTDLAWARGDNELLGFIDQSGKWVIEPKFQTAKSFDPTNDIARIKIDDQWGYTNRSGDVIRIEDTSKWEDFNDGLALGRKDDQFGFFDESGQWVIEPQFEGARHFKNGFAAAKKDGLWGYIDKTGKWVIEPQYAGVKDFEKVN
ncbi:hypothetical protein BFP72_01265 [Reichenbachiella sp. 5M10]|uniref:WG repeat-containing protein n=1 Tax=Reichenbachiella sp. 5M10 TaxID=1889772 RepID=UPI000C5FEBA6|nr:WG repeat-containing protein [Reichenbachiella sp. 5M10]PIB34152.1 hypothetical protein BFP72_01265 [Reichenbachiella sp. 5M10]